MDLKKNDEFELEITGMGSAGEGIGHADGVTFFVKDAIPGDLILAGVTKLNKNIGYARIVRILKASKDRVASLCPVAKSCGGCALQHMDYSAQLEYKQKKVLEDLVRIGQVARDRIEGKNCPQSGQSVEFRKIIGMEVPFHYRNKGQFPVGRAKDGRTVCGFYASHSHMIVESEECLIQHEVTGILVRTVREWMERFDISPYTDPGAAGNGSTRIRHILTRVGFVTHEIMVCLVVTSDSLPYRKELTENLTTAIERYNGSICRKDEPPYCLTSLSYNINREETNVILGRKNITVAGNPYITDYLDDLKFQISPMSFYQVNPGQTTRLYSTAVEFMELSGNEIVWDIYCGIGTISLYVARHAFKVYGVEIVPEAIEDARKNAALNGITNVEFFTGAAEEVFPEYVSKNPGMRADVVVVDPPRKGCDTKLLASVTGLSPERIVYISCDPATLARDVRYLEENGYSLRKVQPVDMFGQSYHVESIALLQRVNNTRERTITLDVEMEDYHRIKNRTEVTADATE